MPPALLVDGIHKTYGRQQALRGVDLEVAEGELFGLLGPNGAGKSTLTKIACDLVRPTAGRVEAVRPLGYLAELFRFPGWCTPDEVLHLHQRLASSPGGAQERADLLERVGLAHAAGRSVEAMSKGMQQRLGLAQALIGRPRLLLLDEPTSALDPAGRRLVRDLLVDLRAQGTAVLLNTHLLGEVELVCDHVAIIDAGAVVARGRPEDLVKPRGVEVDLGSGTRVIEGIDRDDVPRVVADLVASGEEVYGVRMLASTLEDVYLEAVPSP